MAKRKKKLSLKSLDYNVSFLYPSVIFGYKNDGEDSRTFGFKLSNISFGLTYESYDYGNVLDISFFGFGISVWWIY